jgi:hypothetical protein
MSKTTLRITRKEPHGVTAETIILAPGALMTVEGVDGGPRHTIEFSLVGVTNLDIVEARDDVKHREKVKIG